LALLLSLLAAGCAQNGFVRVTVGELDGGKGFPSIFQIRSIASDSDGGTPDSVLGPLESAAIAFPETFVVEVPPTATSLHEVVEGIDINGNTVLRGSNSTLFSPGSQAIPLLVNLSAACNSSLDCNSAAFCQGLIVCSPEGACVATATTSPPAFGTPCGNGGGGCNEEQVCLASFGYCGDGTLGTDPLPDGGTFTKQCDWGTPALDGGCTGPDGGCNSDTLPNHCREACVNPFCGDGILDDDEVCDLGTGPIGNGTENGCNATCTLVGTATRIAGNGDLIALPDGGFSRCTFDCYVDGPGDGAQFQQVSGIAVSGSTLYVADTLNELVRAVDISGPPYTVSTVAGNPAIVTTQDGTGTNAGFFLPRQPLAYQGQLLVGTGMNIRQVKLPGGVVTTLAGPDSGNKASENSSFPVSFANAFFNDVTGLTVDPATGFIYSVDEGSGLIHQLNPATQEDYWYAGQLSSQTKAITFSDPTSAVVVNGSLFVSDTGMGAYEIVVLNLVNDGGIPSVSIVAGNGGTGYVNGVGANASFTAPQGMCTDGKTIYIVDGATAGGNNKAVRQMDPVTFEVTTLIGGPDAGVFDNPYDCAWDPATGTLYVSDQSIVPATPDGVGNAIYKVK
jgi:hypothetical protein